MAVRLYGKASPLTHTLLPLTHLALGQKDKATAARAQAVPGKDAPWEDRVMHRLFRPEVKMLVDVATAKKFDFSKYKDVYTEKLTKLIEAKVAGQEIVTPPVEHHAQVINLMDALKQSVEKLRPGAGKEAIAKPPKKMAPSTRGRAAAPARKKKTS